MRRRTTVRTADGVDVEDVQVPDRPDVVRLDFELASARHACRMIVAPLLDDLDDGDVEMIAALFPRWRVGQDVKVGEVLRWDGTLVEVIQAHTTQADWSPDLVPALFKIHRTPDMTEWVAGISVEVGEQFTYEGQTYAVVQAHTTQTGWEPPAVPALFEPYEEQP